MSLKNPVTTVETILSRVASIAAVWFIDAASLRPSKFSWFDTFSMSAELRIPESWIPAPCLVLDEAIELPVLKACLLCEA